MPSGDPDPVVQNVPGSAGDAASRDGLPRDLKFVDLTPSNGDGLVKFRETTPSPLEGDEDSESDYSTDDEIQYCDCVASALAKSLPGTPGKQGVIPYTSIYETQQQAQKRGYWIPGVPVNAKIVKAEKNLEGGIHFINTFLYTIVLQHGQFEWTVVRNYRDFTLLNQRLMAHRFGEHFIAPIRRMRRRRRKRSGAVQQRFDSYLHEYTGVGGIENHEENCPYYKHPHSHRRARESKLQVLKRTADAFDANNGEAPAPLATVESPAQSPEDIHNIEMATQSGILEHDAEGDTTTNSAKKRKFRRRKKHVLPRFPMYPDSMVTNIEQRKEQLENWLQMVLHIPINRNYHETAEFLEVSRFSFVNELGGKHTEGFVKKRPGGARVFLGWKHFCVRYMLPWSRRWLMVRDSFVAYMDHKTEQIRLVLLMDKDFKVAAGGMEADGIPTGLIITNTQHELHLKCSRLQDTARWKTIIMDTMKGPGAIWMQPQRYGSSFPVRENSYGKWFVDARTYMSKAADMMELAREEIFIADWWLSPEIFMKRPAIEGTYWRLDQILLRKAQQGVKIFVLLYKEMEMALGLNSIYSKKTLQALHPNIKVMRHPDHYPGTGTFFWAHHEKLLVIDQLIAFVGGVDLCFGRWDDDHHLLTDLGSVQFAGAHGVAPTLAAGLRSLVKAPLTFSPLGLEENEMVGEPKTDPATPITPTPTTPLGSVQGRASSSTESAPGQRVTTIMVGDVDEIDSGTRLNDIPEGQEGDDEQQLFTDKETGNVMVRIWKKANRSKSETPTNRHSLPAPVTHSTSVASQGSSVGGKRPPSILKVVEESRNKKTVRRAASASVKRVPQDVLDKAGPAPGMVEKATRSGMDLATATAKYKEYVESGAVAKEKARAQTPPLRKKTPGRLSRAVDNWKSNRAKRKWKQVLDSDEVVAAYELDWLRLQEMDDGEDQLDGGTKLWIGKDYVNYIHKDFVDVDMPFNDFIDRGSTPRMPWHDIHSVTFGAAARDISRHFIQRWNATKTEKLKMPDKAKKFIDKWCCTKCCDWAENDDANYPYLIPKSYENLRVPRVFKNPAFADACNVQVLRSLSNWSGLINQTEDSIQQAYLLLIANSEHYVYIENQFFVSMIGSPDVLNEVCKVLCNRIIRAHEEKTNFRVYIMLPLLPGFEGDVGAPGGSSLQAVLHWTYRSLSQGPNSLFEKLKTVIPDPFKYVSVGSLRTHDMLCGKLVTELVYIHSKLLIVDDQHVIIGSANINDRSQVGNRDSEVCLMFSDIQKETSMMNGKPYQAGKFAKSLRLQCMKEHLSLLPDSRRPSKFKYDVTCDDPVADSFFVDVWQATARSNMRIYEEVFRAYPTDNVETFEEYQMWTSQMSLAEYSPQQAEEKLREVRGSLVEFPLNFLCKATLTPGITSKEGLVPNAVFT